MKVLKSKSFWIGIVVAVIVVLTQAKLQQGELHTRRYWEGLFKDRNFRDVGVSLNECFHAQTFQSGLVMRSNRYFSGWSCNDVGSPTEVLSLNFNPKKNELHYCTQPVGEKLIGRYFNSGFEIADVEKFENWNKPEFKFAMCQFFKEGFENLANHRSFLVHCDVGRDRTGIYVAMLTAAVLESQRRLDDSAIQGIECDYEKTKKLEKEKIGRMTRAITELKNRGGVIHFFETNCGFGTEMFQQAASSLLVAAKP